MAPEAPCCKTGPVLGMRLFIAQRREPGCRPCGPATVRTGCLGWHRPTHPGPETHGTAMRHPILNLGCAALARKGHGVGNRWCGGILGGPATGPGGQEDGLDTFALTNSQSNVRRGDWADTHPPSHRALGVSQSLTHAPRPACSRSGQTASRMRAGGGARLDEEGWAESTKQRVG